MDKAELLNHHKAEKKELQAKIQTLKQTVPKNDKKRRKELMTNISQMEAELESKQQEEILAIETYEPKALENDINNLKINDEKDETYKPRISKAQKRRDKKMQKEKDRDENISKQEIVNLSGDRNMEILKLNDILKEKKLTIHEIPSDGNCLYAAMNHQFLLSDVKHSVQGLREKTSEYMKTHVDDFIPFLCNQETGDLYSLSQYQKYCDDIKETNVWGGQLELQALSESLQCCIEVHQAEGPLISIGEKFKNNIICRLSYHRHIFGLGEHYNSLTKSVEK